MGLNSHYKPWGFVVGTKTVSFCIGTRVWTSHVMWNSLTSDAYCTLLFFWVHLQEWIDMTISDFNTYTVPTYHVHAHTITNAFQSNIRHSQNPHQQVFLWILRDLANQALHVAPQKVVWWSQVGWMCRPNNWATMTYPHLPKSSIQMTSNRTSKMRWCAIVLKPHVLTHMQWHIFQESMQYMFKKIQVYVTAEIMWKKVWPNNTSIQKPCLLVETVMLLKALRPCSTQVFISTNMAVVEIYNTFPSELGSPVKRICHGKSDSSTLRCKNHLQK